MVSREEEADINVSLSFRESQGGGEAGEGRDDDRNGMSKTEDEKAEGDSTRRAEWWCMCTGGAEERYNRG